MPNDNIDNRARLLYVHTGTMTMAVLQQRTEVTIDSHLAIVLFIVNFVLDHTQHRDEIGDVHSGILKREGELSTAILLSSVSQYMLLCCFKTS